VEADSQRRVSSLPRWQGHWKHWSARRCPRLTAVFRFTDEIRDNDIAGLTQGGQYIGWLERFLVMLLLLMDQPNGIGFLIAAKSVLRFGEIKDPSQRKVAEYIIIGTFLSFGWALLISILTQKALRYWIP
jgi:hypothetical protein